MNDSKFSQIRFSLSSAFLIACLVGCQQVTEESGRQVSETESESDSTVSPDPPPEPDPISETETETETKAAPVSTATKPEPAPDDPGEASVSAKPSGITRSLLAQQLQKAFHAKSFVQNLPLEGIGKVYVSFGGEASVESDLSFDELQSACRDSLQSDGWKQDSVRSFPVSADAKYEELFFEKDGLFVSVTTSGPSAGKTDLRVKALGNIDMRKLPAAETFEKDDNATFTYVGYVTDDEIDAAAEFCRQAMVNDGWEIFSCISKPSCLPHPQSPNQVIAFLQGGFTCYATIGRSEGFKDGRTTVNYIATGVLPIDLLVLPDAQDLQLDVLHGRANYVSSQNAPEVRKAVSDFYSRLQYPLIEGRGELAFVDIYRTGKGEQLLVDITPRENGTTAVQLIRQFEDPKAANE